MVEKEVIHYGDGSFSLKHDLLLPIEEGVKAVT
jgi:hypothetical protein